MLISEIKRIQSLPVKLFPREIIAHCVNYTLVTAALKYDFIITVNLNCEYSFVDDEV